MALGEEFWLITFFISPRLYTTTMYNNIRSFPRPQQVVDFFQILQVNEIFIPSCTRELVGYNSTSRVSYTTRRFFLVYSAD